MNREILENPKFEKLLEAYRNSLRYRYSEAYLQKLGIAGKLERAKIDKLVYYFLELLYPSYPKRKELNEAFHALGGFVKNPSKLWGLVTSLGFAVFHLGKSLPEAFRAAISSFHSYTNASRLEELLFQEMLKHFPEKKELSLEDWELLVSKIPKHVGDEFRKETLDLFGHLSNAGLLEKVLYIMDHSIQKISKKLGGVYSEKDLEGVKLGRRILNEGYQVFQELDAKEVQIILDTLEIVEREYYYAAIKKHS